jgi:hypothetical protein
LNQKDSDFLGAREMNKREIFQVFGIPAGMYDPNATEANATIARQTFLEDTIWPKLVRFAQKLTQELAPFFGADLVIEPEDIRDNRADIAEVEAASRYLTINEIRERYFNVAAIAGGDRIAEGSSPHPQPLSQSRGAKAIEHGEKVLRLDEAREGRDRSQLLA